MPDTVAIANKRGLRGSILVVAGLLLCLVAWGLPFSSTAQADGMTPAPECPTRWTCVSLPNNGGTIQVGPSVGVVPVGGANPWVFLRGYGLSPGHVVRVHYCSLVNGLNSPLCATGGNTIFSVDPTVTLKVFADGTIAESTQAPLNPTDSGTPFEAVVPGTSTNGSFFCDGGALSCGLVITDGNLASPFSNTPSAGNSSAVPIQFDLTSASCPSKQSLVVSQSDFGIGPLLPAVNRVNCQKDAAVNFFNTEQSGVSALDELYNSVRSTSTTAVRVAFTDDPQAPSQQEFLPAGHFVLIPVALTATVVGFNSQIFLAGTSYPMTRYNLSANMVAGLFTGAYTGPDAAADPTPCDGACPKPPCVVKTQCSLFQLATEHPGFYSAQQFGVYLLAYQAGITDQLTRWICNAPSATVPWGTTATTEVETAAQVMVRGLAAGGHPVPSCPVTDQWPAETISSALWSASVGPQGQMKAMRSFLPPIGSGATSGSGFAYMSWPWANYLGLDSAGLLNASNTFQTPTKESIYAALSDATLNSDGTLTPTFANKSNKAAYPLPSVIYAAVSTDEMPEAQKASITTALSSMLDVTAGPDTTSGSARATDLTSNLPAGYVPLTPELAKQARDEVRLAIGNPNFKITDVLPQLASTTGTGGTSGLSGPLGNRSLAGSSSLRPGLSGRSGSGAGGVAGTQRVPSSSPRYGSLLLTASSTRMLIPWVAAAGIIALVGGALVLSSGGIAQMGRSLRRRGSSATEGLAPDEVDAP